MASSIWCGKTPDRDRQALIKFCPQTQLFRLFWPDTTDKALLAPWKGVFFGTLFLNSQNLIFEFDVACDNRLFASRRRLNAIFCYSMCVCMKCSSILLPYINHELSFLLVVSFRSLSKQGHFSVLQDGARNVPDNLKKRVVPGLGDRWYVFCHGSRFPHMILGGAGLFSLLLCERLIMICVTTRRSSLPDCWCTFQVPNRIRVDTLFFRESRAHNHTQHNKYIQTIEYHEPHEH